jgi:alpha-mannosidase
LAKINEKHRNASDEFNWPIRRDDTLPYAQHPNQFWNGFYTSRPQLKLSVRELSRSLQSSSRMIAQQVLRKDLSQKKKEDIVHQLHFLYDTLGNLQHHDAITGTSVARVTGDF